MIEGEGPAQDFWSMSGSQKLRIARKHRGGALPVNHPHQIKKFRGTKICTRSFTQQVVLTSVLTMTADLTWKKVKTICEQTTRSHLGTCLKEGRQAVIFRAGCHVMPVAQSACRHLDKMTSDTWTRVAAFRPGASGDWCLMMRGSAAA